MEAGEDAGRPTGVGPVSTQSLSRGRAPGPKPLMQQVCGGGGHILNGAYLDAGGRGRTG